jgi:hypothetical protein
MAHYYASDLQQADALIKTGETFVRSIVIGYKGVTAGEFVTLKDGLNMSGKDKVMVVLPAANGTISIYFGEVGKRFATGLYYNEGATAGNCWVAIDYR